MKYIFIGETTLRVSQQQPWSLSGGVLLAACEAARAGLRALWLSEVGLDAAGDATMRLMASCGLDASGCDRFDQGRTSLLLEVGGHSERYDIHAPGAERFDVSYPRFDEGDVVVFGGWAAIDPQTRPQVEAIIEAARDRKASIVYILDADPLRLTRATRVMPVVFDNLELADAVVASHADIATLFDTSDPSRANADHIAYHCPRLIVADTPQETAKALAALSTGSEATSPTPTA